MTPTTILCLALSPFRPYTVAEYRNGIFPLTGIPSIEFLKSSALHRDRHARFFYDYGWKVAVGVEPQTKKPIFDIATGSNQGDWEGLPSFLDLDRAQHSLDHRAFVITNNYIIGIEYPKNQFHVSPEELWEDYRILHRINKMCLIEKDEIHFFRSFVRQIFNQKIYHWSALYEFETLIGLKGGKQF